MSQALSTFARLLVAVDPSVGDRQLGQIQNLWNWADHQDEPEEYWEAMGAAFPRYCDRSYTNRPPGVWSLPVAVPISGPDSYVITQTLQDWLDENDVGMTLDRYDWKYLADAFLTLGYVVGGSRNGGNQGIYIGHNTGGSFLVQSDPTGTRLTKQNFSVTSYPGVVHLRESSGDNDDLFDRLVAAVGTYPGEEEGDEDGAGSATRLELA